MLLMPPLLLLYLLLHLWHNLLQLLLRLWLVRPHLALLWLLHLLLLLLLLGRGAHWLPAAAPDQVLPGACCVHTLPTHLQSRMQHLPAEDAQRPRQALVTHPAVGGHPQSVICHGRLHTPVLRVGGVVDSWDTDRLQLLLLPL